MVLHPGGVELRVGEHRAVLGDHGQARIEGRRQIGTGIGQLIVWHGGEREMHRPQLTLQRFGGLAPEHRLDPVEGQESKEAGEEHEDDGVGSQQPAGETSPTWRANLIHPRICSRDRAP